MKNRHEIRCMLLLAATAFIFVGGCGRSAVVGVAPPPAPSPFFDTLVSAAVEQTHHHVRYDESYIEIPYPGGDIPDSIGACSDVIIRAYRRLGIDLQKEVHEVLKLPNPSIDHRRVHNLKAFFAKEGVSLPITGNPLDYYPGDIIIWQGLRSMHIGMVSRSRMIVQNIGRGPQEEDVLFRRLSPIVGHYRYWAGRDTLRPRVR